LWAWEIASRRRQEISLDAFLGIAALNPGYGRSGAGVSVFCSTLMPTVRRNYLIAA